MHAARNGLVEYYYLEDNELMELKSYRYEIGASVGFVVQATNLAIARQQAHEVVNKVLADCGLNVPDKLDVYLEPRKKMKFMYCPQTSGK